MRRTNKKKKSPKTLRYRQRTTANKNRILKGIALFVSAVLIIIFFFGDHGIYQLLKINSERKATQKLIAELRIEKKRLEEEKYKLEHNDEYLMKLAREKYRMVLPGEKMFKVIENEEE